EVPGKRFGRSILSARQLTVLFWRASRREIPAVRAKRKAQSCGLGRAREFACLLSSRAERQVPSAIFMEEGEGRLACGDREGQASGSEPVAGDKPGSARLSSGHDRQGVHEQHAKRR